MKYLITFILIALAIYSCDSTKSTIKGSSASASTSSANDTIRIANDSLEYEILIIEPGFDTWLITQPPRSFYEVSYLESRNLKFVSVYNQRVYNTSFDSNLYQQEINYEYNVHYGREVNYLLYQYFIYFQKQYKQRL